MDKSYLIDALGLRSHLRGELPDQSGISKSLFSNTKIRKIFIGECALLQLVYDFSNQEDGIKNYVTFLSELDESNTLNDGINPNLQVLQKTIDYRVRSTDPQLIDQLC